MTYTPSYTFDEALVRIASALDIPDYVYEEAVLKYEDVSAWLAVADSKLKPYSPELYPQGSFRLGTVVRPISEADEYDIDLVCRLQLYKEQTTQANLKELVGDRLKQRKDLAEMLDESRRCWRLDYPAESARPHFHLDILPAIANPDNPPTGIQLTDTDLIRWQKSDPKAYADWFYKRMEEIFVIKRAMIAKLKEATIEEVPEWQVKTPLQVAVQILKRHRDIFFQDDCENRPVSIIITTLAALAYRGQGRDFEALSGILHDMPRFIEIKNSKWWVANPVEPDENFADKWNEYPKRKLAFDRWLRKATEDFAAVSSTQPFYKSASALESILGRGVVTKALSESPNPGQMQIQVPGVGDSSHCQRPMWPVREQYKAKVSGDVYWNSKRVWALVDRPVNKHMSLRFTVSTNTPAPYEVVWQVVNTGKEAATAKCLRGDYYTGTSDSGRIRLETTYYMGTHWVEAFIIKGGVCVARSGRKLVRVR